MTRGFSNLCTSIRTNWRRENKREFQAVDSESVLEEMLDTACAVGRADRVTASDAFSETALNELANELFRQYDSEEASPSPDG